jgi:hypothetical protein
MNRLALCVVVISLFAALGLVRAVNPEVDGQDAPDGGTAAAAVAPASRARVVGTIPAAALGRATGGLPRGMTERPPQPSARHRTRASRRHTARRVARTRTVAPKRRTPAATAPTTRARSTPVASPRPAPRATPAPAPAPRATPKPRGAPAGTGAFDDSG